MNLPTNLNEFAQPSAVHTTATRYRKGVNPACTTALCKVYTHDS